MLGGKLEHQIFVEIFDEITKIVKHNKSSMEWFINLN